MSVKPFLLIILSFLLITEVFCVSTIDELPEVITRLLEWSKNNEIEISEKLRINQPGKFSPNHTFFYFTAKEDIPENTTLLHIPADAIISPSSLEEFMKDSKNKKLANLWKNINKIESQYLAYWDTKQLFYITILFENAIHKKKGNLYTKFGPYLDLYEDINMDNFPIFYIGKEIQFLAGTNLALSLRQAVESLKEEYYLIKNSLNISNCLEDNYMKYRMLALANSVSYRKSENDTLTESIIIPFIDFFGKRVNASFTDAQYILRKTKDGKVELDIVTTRDIKKGAEIFVKAQNFPNQDCLLYYGFTDENNYLVPDFYIDTFNRMFRKHMEVLDVDFSKVMLKETFEINEVLDPQVLETYNKLYKHIDRYKDKEEGAYLMEIANLNYYYDLLRFTYEDQLIENKLIGDQKIRDIKIITKIEKLIVETALDKVKKAMNDFLKKKGKPIKTDLTGDL